MASKLEQETSTNSYKTLAVIGLLFCMAGVTLVFNNYSPEFIAQLAVVKPEMAKLGIEGLRGLGVSFIVLGTLLFGAAGAARSASPTP